MAAEMARRSDEAEAKLAREPRMSVSDHVDRVCEVDMKKTASAYQKPSGCIVRTSEQMLSMCQGKYGMMYCQMSILGN